MPDSDGEYWFAVLLHRDDLEACGFDSFEVDDEMMRKLADAMEESYRKSGFYIELNECANRLGIPMRDEG
jgi:hypothetical protein